MNTASDIIDLPDAAAAVDRASRAALAPPLSATLSAARARAADFYELTKPRMNFLVVVTTMVGFYMAMGRHFSDWALLAHTLIGTGMAAAGASVLNQYVERGYDVLMNRTSNRPLPAGRISPVEALL